MAFDGPMKMMGKPKAPMAKKALPDTRKGKEKETPAGKTEGEHGDGAGDAMSVEKSGEGYKTSDGQEHGHLGAALMHVAHHHEPEGKHMHMHHDGYSIKSHGVHESGEHDGPHEHGSAEEAGAHAASFMGDGMGEDSGNEEVGNEPTHSMSGF